MGSVRVWVRFRVMVRVRFKVTFDVMVRVRVRIRIRVRRAQSHVDSSRSRPPTARVSHPNFLKKLMGMRSGVAHRVAWRTGPFVLEHSDPHRVGKGRDGGGGCPREASQS